MNTALCNETFNSQSIANLRLSTPQAGGRNKAIILETQDKVDKVIDKLETLSNLFEFYWYAREKTGFNKDSINGLTLIISDCIGDLKEAVKYEPC